MLVGPLTLATTPHVVMQQYIGINGEGIPNQFAVPWLEWAAAPVYYLIYQPWPAVLIGLGVLYSRALFGDADVRARMRVMTWVVTAALASFVVWTVAPPNWPTAVAVFASLIAVPLASVHGIFRYGAFNIAADDRGRMVARSSDLLITVLYAIGTATPAVLLASNLTATGAVLLTTVLAVCLLPLRGGCSAGSTAPSSATGTASWRCSASSAPGWSSPSNPANCSHDSPLPFVTASTPPGSGSSSQDPMARSPDRRWGCRRGGRQPR